MTARASLAAATVFIVGFAVTGPAALSAQAQCAENNYIHDGAPSALLDCQPLAALRQLPPDEMTPADRLLADQRHAELVQAARFYGFDLDAPGWTFQQTVSPVLSKHLLLAFTDSTPADRASHFMAVVPAASDEKVQIVPAFARGLHPYLPGWQAKGSYAVFNRLLSSERREQPISRHSAWIEFAVLYLTLVGHGPVIPTETDSVKANWDLSVKRGTTPVILVAKDGAATIVLSDLSDAAKTTGWKLLFNRQGQMVKAERSERTPARVRLLQAADRQSEPAPASAAAR